MANAINAPSASLNNIAVLIDADNTSAKSISDVLQKIAKLGSIGCKKAFGDWSCAHLQSWQPELLTHVIDPIQQFAFIKGKNATDIAMVIEAMDLLHRQEFDGFCLVSSDSDFTPLAIRIRQNKVKAIGFGKRDSSDSFIKSCDDFYFIEYLAQSSRPAEPITPTPTPTPKVSLNMPPSQPAAIQPWTQNQLKCDTKLLTSLRDAVNNHPKSEKSGWVNVSQAHQQLNQIFPEFEAKNYGYTKITSIIRAIGLFETKVDNSTLYIRLKPIAVKAVSAAANSSANNTPSPRWPAEKLQKQTHFITVIDKLIKENPSPDNGWTNLSYLASQIKQNHPNINWKKYGYAKFSELVLALAIYDTRRKNNGIFIKQKNKLASLQ